MDSYGQQRLLLNAVVSIGIAILAVLDADYAALGRAQVAAVVRAHYGLLLRATQLTRKGSSHCNVYVPNRLYYLFCKVRGCLVSGWRRKDGRTTILLPTTAVS